MDRVVAGAAELQRVQRLIEKLPSKCRQVFVLRRIHGVSQREIACERAVSLDREIVMDAWTIGRTMPRDARAPARVAASRQRDGSPTCITP